MKQSFSLFAALCCVFSFLMPQQAAAMTVCYNGVYYYSDGKTGYVVSDIYYTYSNRDHNYYSLSGDVYIASYVPDIGEITLISDRAFAYKEKGGAINIILPSTIKAFEESAFAYATKLNSIQLNEGLTTIGEKNFPWLFQSEINIHSFNHARNFQNGI